MSRANWALEVMATCVNRINSKKSSMIRASVFYREEEFAMSVIKEGWNCVNNIMKVSCTRSKRKQTTKVSRNTTSQKRSYVCCMCQCISTYANKWMQHCVSECNIVWVSAYPNKWMQEYSNAKSMPQEHAVLSLPRPGKLSPRVQGQRWTVVSSLFYLVVPPC